MVVHVPQGSTAYQARNHLYYSRSEFETKSMPDHEVRLRMQRGRSPQARLELNSWKRVTADLEFQRRLKTMEDIAARREAGEVLFYGRGIPTAEDLEAPIERDFDEYQFQFAVLNTGEMTIRDFVLAIRLVTPDDKIRFVGKQHLKIGVEFRFRFLRASEMGMPGRSPEKKLFPGDRIHFPDLTFSLCVAAGDTLRIWPAHNSVDDLFGRYGSH